MAARERRVISFVPGGETAPAISKSFLLLFFKKEALSGLPQSKIVN
jgi:hypothetical protein